MLLELFYKQWCTLCLAFIFGLASWWHSTHFLNIFKWLSLLSCIFVHIALYLFCWHFPLFVGERLENYKRCKDSRKDARSGSFPSTSKKGSISCWWYLMGYGRGCSWRSWGLWGFLLTSVVGCGLDRSVPWITSIHDTSFSFKKNAEFSFISWETTHVFHNHWHIAVCIQDDGEEVTWQTYKGQLTEKQEKTRGKILKRTEKASVLSMMTYFLTTECLNDDVVFCRALDLSFNNGKGNYLEFVHWKFVYEVVIFSSVRILYYF